MNKLLTAFKKNKNLSIMIVVVVVLVVLGGVFLITRSSNTSSTSQQAAEAPAPTDQPVLKVAPADLGITLVAGAGNKTVNLTVADIKDLVSVDYELSYMATVNGSQVSRGAIGSLDLKKKPAAKEITLGTCSDVCHYDTGVSDIKVTLKISKIDGKVYQSDLTLSL